MLTYACSILALLLLWAVYPKDYNYGDAAAKGLLFYPANAIGRLPPNNPIPWRNDSLLYEKAPKFGFDDLTGGWMVGGIAGKHPVGLWGLVFTAWSVMKYQPWAAVVICILASGFRESISISDGLQLLRYTMFSVARWLDRKLHQL